MRHGVLVAAAVLMMAGNGRSDEAADRHAAAVKLMGLFGLDTTYDQAMQQAMQLPLDMIEKEQMPEADKAKAREAVQAAMKVTTEKFSWNRMKDMFADIYAEVLTTEEISGLIAFYESPAGKAFLAKQPELTAATMKRMQSVMEDLMATLKKQLPPSQAPAPAPVPADR